MGGIGSGGHRVGAGRKSKADEIARLHGSRQRTKKPPAVASTAVLAPAAEVAMPGGMTKAQRGVWLVLAPLAAKARTLTNETAGSFMDLCRIIALHKALQARIQRDGWTFIGANGDRKKHPLWTEFRGYEQRVEAGRARFLLAPLGKPIIEEVKEVDPLAEFDGPVLVKGSQTA